MISEWYTIDFHCDSPNDNYLVHKYTSGSYISMNVSNREIIFSFLGRNKTLCLNQAKKAGWKIGYDGLVLCPMCKSVGRTLRSLRKQILEQIDK